MERNEDSIDLGRLFRVMCERKAVIFGIVGACTLVALVIAFVLPKQYESTTLVQTSSANASSSGTAAALAALGGSGASSPTMNYMELMKSRTVLEPIIDSLDFDGEEKKPTAKAFAKKYLDIKNTKGTNLIEVSARWESPEEAQRISQTVVDNFLLMQTDMNQQTQSLLVTFLEKRIDESKEASEDAEAKLLAFSKEHKIYSPDDQVKHALSQILGFDKAMADFEVSIKSGQASLDAANTALEEQKMSSRVYSVSDNKIVQELRSQIVAKQVELVGLRQNYTDKHPSIQRAEEELQQLEKSLHNEVTASVESNAVTLNPTQSELLKQQALASVGLSVAKASKKAVEEEWGKKEEEIGKLPDDVLEYVRLQRNVTIQNEVYLNLVKQSEQHKIQAAMESMDIQIIDPADLPDIEEPVAPRKKLITLVGFLMGCILAFGYGFRLYRKEA
ncbi:MAG: GumC family protein [Selenomonas massiliensis]